MRLLYTIRRRSVCYYLVFLISFGGMALLYQTFREQPLNCLFPDALTFAPGGDFGDIMCQYAHLKHLQLSHDLKVGILKIADDILSVYPDMTVPVLPRHCIKKSDRREVELMEILKEIVTEGRLAKSAIIIGRPCDLRLLWPLRDVWDREFVLSDDDIIDSQDRIDSYLDNRKLHGQDSALAGGKVPVLVGVDVRRTTDDDIPPGSLLPPSYYHTAFDYYREKYAIPIFLVSCDDPDWCRENLVQDTDSNDVLLMEYTQPYQNIDLLASLPHLVLSHGSCGVWAALLSHGQTIAYPAPHGESERYHHHRFFDEAHIPGVVSVEFSVP